MKRRFDLAIAGGGPAALATALRAAQHGMSTLVIEKSPSATFHVGETVPVDIQNPLQKLGVWEEFRTDGHLAVAGACSSWGQEELICQDAFSSIHENGWRLDRFRFDTMLQREAVAAGVVMIKRHRLSHIERSEDRFWQLHLNGSTDPLEAKFFVDATGRAASFARRLGATRVRVDRMVALCASIKLGQEVRQGFHTMIEATEIGWWYCACVAEDKAVACFFTDNDIAQKLGCLRAEAWLRLFKETRHAFSFLGKSGIASAVQAVSAESYCLDHVYGRSWLAVGDAATAWDPLASAGIFLALHNGIEAADAIVAHLTGDQSSLDEYQHTIRMRFTHFLAERRHQYSLEERWRIAPFWARRARRLTRG